jgi:hypothetical protein
MGGFGLRGLYGIILRRLPLPPVTLTLSPRKEGGTMVRGFEDHCWEDVVDPLVLEDVNLPRTTE